MTFLLVTLLAVSIAMGRLMRRGLAGSWWHALRSEEASSYLPFLPGHPEAGHTSGTTQLEVQQNHQDTYIGVPLKDEEGTPILVSRIRSKVDDHTLQSRHEQVDLGAQ